MVGGIYRVVKAIDAKVESLLDEIKEMIEMKSEDSWGDYWNDNGCEDYR